MVRRRVYRRRSESRVRHSVSGPLGCLLMLALVPSALVGLLVLLLVVLSFFGVSMLSLTALFG